MFHLEEQRPHFTNMFDAYYLLGQVFWCGCEIIAFTTYNIFTDLIPYSLLPTACTASHTTSAIRASTRSSTCEDGGEGNGEAGGENDGEDADVALPYLPIYI
jgi:hypothetical protein